MVDDPDVFIGKIVYPAAIVEQLTRVLITEAGRGIGRNPQTETQSVLAGATYHNSQRVLSQLDPASFGFRLRGEPVAFVAKEAPCRTIPTQRFIGR